MDDRNYYLGFSNCPGIGPIKFKLLLSHFGSAKNAWGADKISLKQILGEKLSLKFDKFRKEFSIEDYLKKLHEKGVWLLTLKDKEYPSLLSQIPNPPFVLYGRGQVLDSTWFSKTIAVVGARKTTQYGREVTKILTQGLVERGLIIVSGLAIGVDAIAHTTTLENNGKTIAVLGSGVDCCYPRENLNVYKNIIENGSCVISEYPLGQLPTIGSFPSRNRIIAGISAGVLVTEGAEDSGSLITASNAASLHRPVFAVPGPITSGMSKGPFKLIQRGAKMVGSAEEILIEFKIKNSPARIATQSVAGGKVKNSTPEEDKILKLLENEPLHFDEIVRRSGLASSRLGSLLSVMEVRGLIKSSGNGTFSIILQ